MMQKRLTKMALLTAVALIIFVVEAQIPVPIPIPGIKLGLANIITVYAMFELGPSDTWKILLCRIILGSIFAGQMVNCLYSLGGGICCFFLMWAMKRVVSEKQIWICSALGGAAHNIGQLCVAAAILQTPVVFSYLTYLIPAGLIAGSFTGICAQLVVNRLHTKA